MPKIPLLNPLFQAWLLDGPLSAQVPATSSDYDAAGTRLTPQVAA
jgi:hypothetical protein